MQARVGRSGFASKPLTEGFKPATALEKAVHQGRYDAAIDCLRHMSAAERESLRAGVVRLYKLIDDARWSWDKKRLAAWGGESTQQQQRAIAGALVLCGTTADIAGSFVAVDDLLALANEFHPSCLNGLADAMLRRSPQTIRTVQALITAGLVPRPDSDDYALALMNLAGRHTVPIEQAFADDPGLKQVLLRVMDVEGTTDCSLAGIDKYSPAPQSWSQTLLGLCAKGIYTRETLLDKALSSLERDWPQFRAGWFSRFHADLVQGVDMMTPHAQRYLALCHSRIAPTVALALGALKQLDEAGVLDARSLLEAMRPVMAASVKAQVDTALKLIDRVVARDASLRKEASALIVIALAHDTADVQKQVLRRLAEWGLGAVDRGRLLELLPSVAAVHRPALERLIGAPPVAASNESAEALAQIDVPVDRVGAIDPSRVLAPIESTNELVECIAHVFENDTDIDAFERALAALVCAAPITDADRVRLGPVIKRAGKVRKPVANELARLLLFLTTGQRIGGQPTVDHGGNPSSVQAQLIARLDDLMDLAAQGHGLPPLSAPTHQRGLIDPAAFVERVAMHQAQGLVSTRAEQVRALLRLTPAPSDNTRARARQLADSPFTHALRYALGDNVEPDGDAALMAAAARIRHPGGNDTALAQRFGDLGPDGSFAARFTWDVQSTTSDYGNTHHLFKVIVDRAHSATEPDLLAVMRHAPSHAEARPWYSRWTFAGIDEASVLYAATLLPSSLETYFTEGARAIGGNLDWWEAQWHNRAYLHPLQDPTVPTTPMSTLLLALALAGKEPGQTALAIDAFVQCRAEGRLDTTALAAAARDLLRTPIVKAARYAKSLRAALRIDPGAGAAVVEILCAMLAANPAEPPKDTAALLELLQEVSLTSRLPLPSGARTTLEALQLSGKGRGLKTSLLAQP